MKHSTKLAVMTTALFLIVVAAASLELDWAILWVPGILLVWYGLITSDDRPKIAVQNRARTGLH